MSKGVDVTLTFSARLSRRATVVCRRRPVALRQRSPGVRNWRASRPALPVIFDIDYRPYPWPSAEIAPTCCRAAGPYADLIRRQMTRIRLHGRRAVTRGSPSAAALGGFSAALGVLQIGPRAAAVTSARSAMIRSRHSFLSRALKPTGAGDKFHGRLLSGCSRGPRHPRRRAARLGLCGHRRLKARLRARHVDHCELEDFLSTHSGPTPV